MAEEKMQRPKNAPLKYDELFVDINRGHIKIPRFQRDFVWNKEQTARLIDSLIKGYPIGTFILWKTSEELRFVRNIGNIELPDFPEGEKVQYILDGQQRITSLYAVRKGIRLTRDGKEVDYRDICIDLSLDPNSDEPVVFVEPLVDRPTIGVHRLLTVDAYELATEYDKAEFEKIGAYRTRLTTYDFSTVVIEDYPIDIACEVFTRINTGGTELTLFEIMVAKTFDQQRGFDLSQEYDWLIDHNGTEKDLEDANFDTVPHSTILQCISLHMVGQARRKDILKLDKDAFIDAWPIVKDGIFYAVDYIRNELRIPVSQLLPYHTLIVPLCYFFIRNSGNPPTTLQNKLLAQYFWWASLTNRFSSAVESKLAQDRERFDTILRSETPEYRTDEWLQLTENDLRWHPFSTGDAFCKAILCLYANHEPLSFINNMRVRIDNSWLKQSNSRNYHHFFPKGHLRRQGIRDEQANVIANITIVDDYLNKRKIRSRAPSDYMAEYQNGNPHLDKALASHLIGDLVGDGITTDDYDTFITVRTKRILKELNDRLDPDLAAFV